MKYLLCLWATLATLSISCGKADDAGSTQPEYRDDIGFGLTGLAGTVWKRECNVSEDGERSSQLTIWLHDSRYELTSQSFDGDTCDNNLRRATYFYKYSDVEHVAPDLEGWETYSYQLASLTLTLWTAELVEAYNANSIYGSADWALNAAKDVAGLQFDAETEAEIAVGAGRMFTVKRDGDLLYFARYDDDVAVEDYTYFYHKQ